MTKVQYVFIFLALATLACSPPAPETTQSDIAAAALIAAPGVTITGGELNAGGDQYEVTGTLPNGYEIEIDMVRSNGVWTVVEIQRDIVWSSVPEPVRATAVAALDSFEPIRVIESTQAVDGSIVYELFRATEDRILSGGGPDMEVRWHEGSAEVIP